MHSGYVYVEFIDVLHPLTTFYGISIDNRETNECQNFRLQAGTQTHPSIQNSICIQFVFEETKKKCNKINGNEMKLLDFLAFTPTFPN